MCFSLLLWKTKIIPTSRSSGGGVSELQHYEGLGKGLACEKCSFYKGNWQVDDCDLVVTPLRFPHRQSTEPTRLLLSPGKGKRVSEGPYCVVLKSMKRDPIGGGGGWGGVLAREGPSRTLHCGSRGGI